MSSGVSASNSSNEVRIDSAAGSSSSRRVRNCPQRARRRVAIVPLAPSARSKCASASLPGLRSMRLGQRGRGHGSSMDVPPAMCARPLGQAPWFSDASPLGMRSQPQPNPLPEIGVGPRMRGLAIYGGSPFFPEAVDRPARTQAVRPLTRRLPIPQARRKPHPRPSPEIDSGLRL